MIRLPSANFNSRKKPVEMLVLHYTGMETTQAALDRLRDPAAEVSAHYVIDEDGEIYSLIDEDKRAWHAGVSSWKGKTDINSRSIGIEIANPGHEFGRPAFPEKQILSVITLSKDIIERHSILSENIVGHSDIAPLRKRDPGEMFPWKLLAENGIGLWTDDFAAPETSVLEMLRVIGYDTTGEQAALKAFQRRFYPEALLNGAPRTTERLAAVSKLYER